MNRLWLRRVIPIGVVGVVSLIAACTWWYWPDPPINASGQELFHTRDLGSPYTTGIPYALALAALKRYPEVLGGNADEFCAKFGVLQDSEKSDGLPVGFVLYRDRRTDTDFLMTNCALCHTAVIDGRKIPGLGNRNLRMNALNHAVLHVAGDSGFTEDNMIPAAEAAARERGLIWGWRSRLATKTAVRKLREMAAAEADQPAGGLLGIDAGPGRNTPIEFAKDTLHVPLSPPHGFAKYSAVWTYRYRSTFGHDGSLVGDRALALSAVEFNKGMPGEDILKQPQVWQRLYEYLGQLQAPAFPHPLERERVEEGRHVYEAHCAKCHGRSQPDGSLAYEEEIIPMDRIRTDPDRLRSVTPELIEARGRTKLGERVQLIASAGYVPPPLVGIWCRGPYLHNASVPTLADLLRPAAERPIEFYVGGDTGYDLERLGLPYEEEIVDGARFGKRASSRQSLFDTRAPGNSNGGHSYGTSLSEGKKRALMEFLKTL